MTTQEIAEKLVNLCRAGKYEQVYLELYAPEIVSKEPEEGGWKTTHGMDELQAKGDQWRDMVEEVLESEISDPLAADDYFTCRMRMKVKLKGFDEPSEWDELCLYQVKDGKVVLEQFFYTPTTEMIE
ncbi:nuclear transport factor 2 family protein [Marinoscillum furvescens]|uniref:SnoaL-like domain-containing protein n=1 Tax=Marinoscillum furvescens DSM 4134 TaxID=1122208 RepID=A0A3D9L4I9_MARFU|nr:nuclear transport factor 2 family protein [Marinoscillum furvescens]RED97860.1 hypothetical protein C7460_1111 [Marinoscillum furvescens DSM 4134]